MPGKEKPMMGHEPKMGHKPKMGHEPKMDHKPKKVVDISKVGKGQQRMIESIIEKARDKMATPKMNDDKNFTAQAQEMAAMLVPKMDHAKMYKPTKYHDGPKAVKPGMKAVMDKLEKIGKARELDRKAQTMPLMGHEPKMGHKPKAYHDKK
jgi:hypothetical protein